MWKELSENEKAKYEQLAEEDKLRCERISQSNFNNQSTNSNNQSTNFNQPQTINSFNSNSQSSIPTKISSKQELQNEESTTVSQKDKKKEEKLCQKRIEEVNSLKKLLTMAMTCSTMFVKLLTKFLMKKFQSNKLKICV